MTEARLPHEDIDPTGLAFAKAAAIVDYPVESLCFVTDALFYAPRYCDTLEWGGHVRGQALCTALVRYAQETFEADALDVLAEWGLVVGEDVARVVEALLAEGLIRSSDRDSFSDFEEVGLLSRLVR